MSERSRELPRRSVLAVPGSSDRFLHKAPTLAADMFLLDIEDAVAPSEKAAARDKVVSAVHDLDFGEAVLGVRIIGWSTTHTLRDVLEVVGRSGERLDVVMLPKAESAAQVVALDLVLSQVEAEVGLAPGRTGVEVQIESARGLASVEEICAASPRLEAVILGPVDLAASLGMPMLTGGEAPSGYPGDHYHAVHLALLVAARVHGLQAIDGPFLRLDDDEGLAAFAGRTRALGFDGKWAIHPSQIATLNALFTPPPAQVARAEAMLAALDAAELDEKRGALRDAGEMLDEASRKLATAVLRRAGRGAGR